MSQNTMLYKYTIPGITYLKSMDINQVLIVFTTPMIIHLLHYFIPPVPPAGRFFTLLLTMSGHSEHTLTES